MKPTPNPLRRMLYGATAALALFTGFGNMPLYGRYYVADLPGLGWSGNFFINANVHILAGSILVAMGVYAVMIDRLAKGRRAGRLTRSGKIRIFILALALATGVVMVAKNLPGVTLPMPALMVFNFTHMGAAMLFMIVSIMALIFRQPWRQT